MPNKILHTVGKNGSIYFFKVVGGKKVRVKAEDVSAVVRNRAMKAKPKAKSPAKKTVKKSPVKKAVSKTVNAVKKAVKKVIGKSKSPARPAPKKAGTHLKLSTKVLAAKKKEGASAAIVEVKGEFPDIMMSDAFTERLYVKYIAEIKKLGNNRGAFYFVVNKSRVGAFVKNLKKEEPELSVIVI